MNCGAVGFYVDRKGRRHGYQYNISSGTFSLVTMARRADGTTLGARPVWHDLYPMPGTAALRALDGLNCDSSAYCSLRLGFSYYESQVKPMVSNAAANAHVYLRDGGTLVIDGYHL